MLFVPVCVLLAAAPNPQLAQAEQLVASVRYADADKALVAAWATPNNPRETVLRILELRGIVSSVLGRPKARDYFRQLLSLDPERKLPDGQPPRVRTPFYEAKGLVTEAAPMKFSASSSVAADGLRLSARLSADPLALARKVRFHTRAGDGWKDTDATLTALVATVPGGRDAISWWAELLGEYDAVLLTAGSAERPLAAEATDLKRPAAEPKTPVAGLEPVPAATPASGLEPVITEPVAAAAPSRPLLVPVLLWSGAAASVAGGAVLGVMSNASYAQVTDAAQDPSGVVTGLTQKQAAALRDAGRNQAVVANILFGSAVAFAGAGLAVFLLTSPAPVAIAPTPGGVVVGGAF